MASTPSNSPATGRSELQDTIGEWLLSDTRARHNETRRQLSIAQQELRDEEERHAGTQELLTANTRSMRIGFSLRRGIDNIINDLEILLSLTDDVDITRNTIQLVRANLVMAIEIAAASNDLVQLREVIDLTTDEEMTDDEDMFENLIEL